MGGGWLATHDAEKKEGARRPSLSIKRKGASAVGAACRLGGGGLACHARRREKGRGASFLVNRGGAVAVEIVLLLLRERRERGRDQKC